MMHTHDFCAFQESRKCRHATAPDRQQRRLYVYRHPGTSSTTKRELTFRFVNDYKTNLYLINITCCVVEYSQHWNNPVTVAVGTTDVTIGGAE